MSKRNNMPRERERGRETAGIHQELFLFFVAFLTYLFAGFVSTAVHLIRDAFLERTPKWHM